MAAINDKGTALELLTRPQTGCEDECAEGKLGFFIDLMSETGKKIDTSSPNAVWKSLPEAPYPAFYKGELNNPPGHTRPTELQYMRALVKNECTNCNMKAQIGEFGSFKPGARFWIGSACLGLAVILAVTRR